MKVSIKDLKDHLSSYLKQVQLGKEMVITFHNKSIARIIPIKNREALLVNRDEWINKIKKLHHSLGKLNTIEPTSQTIIKMRKAERF
ncbi:hypothetical protein BH10PSE19_BH10PSE19_22220 [soil metagenome]